MKFIKSALISCTVLLIVGCGGEESDNSSSSTKPDGNNPESTTAISALDVSTAVYEQEPTVVSLKSSVMTSDNTPAVLASVTPMTESAQCNNYTVGNMTFTVTGQETGVCVYKYQVEDAEGTTSAQAYAQVAISGTGAPLVSNNNLPTLSAAIQLGESVNIQLDPPTATNGVDKMTLSSSTTILGAGIVSDVDVNANTITYTAGASEADAGISRIFYSYYDDDGLVRTGVIDVAVSIDTYNQAPKASNWTYVQNEELMSGQSYTGIKEQQEVTVDLELVYLAQDTQGSLISDDDTEDELQLVNLQVFNATVDFYDKTDMDNKSFTFSASRAGNYYVTYTVSDHKGGYASGIIEFHVQGTWPDVIVDSTGDVFAAPLSLEAATVASYDIAGIAAEASAPDGNGYSNVPTYTWDAANSICKARGGSLPTRTQLNDFIRQEQNPFLKGDGTEHEMASGWPIARAYFTRTFDDGDPNLVWAMVNDAGSTYLDLVSSGIDGVSEPYLGYLICIDKTPKSLSIENSILLMDMDQTLSATFATASGVSFPYTKPLYWYASEPENAALDAMPDIESNVQLNQYSGDFYATAEGYIHIKAETPLGDLSDEKDINVIRNLLAIDLDPSFETYPAPNSDVCGEAAADIDGNWAENITNAVSRLSVVYNCDDAPQGSNFARITPPVKTGSGMGYYYLDFQRESANMNLIVGEEYNVSFWARINDELLSYNSDSYNFRLQSIETRAFDTILYSPFSGDTENGRLVSGSREPGEWGFYSFHGVIKSDDLPDGTEIPAYVKIQSSSGKTGVQRYYDFDDLIVAPYIGQ